jgi:aspartate aminotransferase
LSKSTRLGYLRDEIESITLSIIDLIGRRNALAHDVAVEKSHLGASLVNLAVERHLQAAVASRCETACIDTAFGLRILNQLIDESIRLQQKTIAPETSYNGHEIFSRAKEIEQSGGSVIHLEVGEPDFGPPKVAVQAMTDAITRGFTHYTQSTGIPLLREKIAKILSQTYHRALSSQDVIITVSGKYALFLGIASSLQAGDEAIIINPSFPAYTACVKEVGGRPVHISTELNDNWNLDVNTVRDNINQSTRLIILNSPCNPTGRVLDERTCRDLVNLTDENDIRILSDEVYSAFSYTPHTSFLQFPLCSQIVVKSFSKSYGMTGFRLGYAISDPDTIKRMASLQYLHLTSAPEFIQHAGVAALDFEEEVNRNASIIKSRLHLASKILEKLPVSFEAADGSFYIFVRIDNGRMDGVEFAERLLSEKGVCVTPGVVYGPRYSSFFRISVCQPEDRLKEGLSRMEELLS